MGLNLVLVTQRQSSHGVALSWSPMDDVSSYEVFVASRRLSPDELEAAQSQGGTGDCIVARLGAAAKSVVDDVSPQGEARFYAVAMRFNDGSVRAARFRAVPDGATADAVPLSTARAGARAAARPAAARPAAAAPADEDPMEARKRAQREARMRASGEIPPAPAAAAPRPAPAPAEDPIEARRRAQREARERTMGEPPTEPPEPAAPPPQEDPIEARRRAQLAARERAAAAAPAAAPAEDPMEARKRAQAAARGAPPPESAASAEPPPPPSAVPLESDLELSMKGGNQTWDGLRIHWERAGGAAAFEIVVSDHQIFGDEVRDALAGKADFTTAVAVAPGVTCVIDNVTQREARGWYAVLVRHRDGRRVPHPFQLGDAAASGKPAAPFLNANRTNEVRAEAEDLAAQAKEQWDRWKGEHDEGAKREARRLAGDALLIFPGLASAKGLLAEMG